MRFRRMISFLDNLLIIFLMTAPARASSILGGEWEKLFKERVTFAGFIENTTGLSIVAGDSKFTTSNRFIMNRFVIQPEFNFDFDERVKLFISWRLDLKSTHLNS